MEMGSASRHTMHRARLPSNGKQRIWVAFPGKRLVTTAVNDTAIEMKRRYGRDQRVGSNGSQMDVLDRVQLANVGVQICLSVSRDRVFGEFISEYGSYSATRTVLSNGRRGPSNPLRPACRPDELALCTFGKRILTLHARHFSWTGR